jgi:hypothetical protein
MATLEQTAADYQRAADEADAVIVGEMTVLLAQLRTYAQSVAHKRTGRMAASLYVDGPVRRVGVIEGAVLPGVAYAENEVAKGGEHDYAGRTLADQAAAIDAWAEATGVQIVKRLGGV